MNTSGHETVIRVLIDCTQLPKLKAGLGTYGHNLVRELLALNTSAFFWIVVQSDDADMMFDHPHVHVIKAPAKLFRRLPLRFLLEQVYLPWLSWKHSINILHSLHYSFPLMPLRARKFVTVHDMTSFGMPDIHISSKGRYYRLFLRIGWRHADHMIFVSRSTLKDYLKRFPRSPDSCHITLLGKSGDFRPDICPESVSRVLEKYRVGRPYLLFVGMIEPRKNLTRLVRAFAGIAPLYPRHSLVIAGSKGWMYKTVFEEVRRQNLEGRVLFPGFVAEEDKAYLIRGAEVFVYPSLYEGFGIPVLEALACGIPTLTSDVSSMPEVAGNAALFCDPFSTEDMRAALERLVGDGELRASLAAEAVLQAQKFDWKLTARETYQAYCTAIAGDSDRRPRNAGKTAYDSIS